jgi:CheY-like chemotaxis protein
MAKILLVEDNEYNREMLVKRLERIGFQVVAAVDGRQGLEMAGSESPDLILMDLDLPEIDGWEATRRIKANPATSSIPVIALTAHAMQQDLKKAVVAGCNHYETKPVMFVRLVGKINACINRRAAGD